MAAIMLAVACPGAQSTAKENRAVKLIKSSPPLRSTVAGSGLNGNAEARRHSFTRTFLKSFDSLQALHGHLFGGFQQPLADSVELLARRVSELWGVVFVWDAAMASWTWTASP